MMQFKRPSIFGVKSTHLEAYIMFQIAATHGSAEAYFYLAMMQSYGLDNFKNKEIDFSALKNSRVDAQEYI